MHQVRKSMVKWDVVISNQFDLIRATMQNGALHEECQRVEIEVARVGLVT